MTKLAAVNVVLHQTRPISNHAASRNTVKFVLVYNLQHKRRYQDIQYFLKRCLHSAHDTLFIFLIKVIFSLSHRRNFASTCASEETSEVSIRRLAQVSW